MKDNIPRWIIVALSVTLASGCTSIRTRADLLRDDWQLYPGLRQGVADFGSALSGDLRKPAWLNGVLAPLLLADLPVSAALDTLALPYDIYRVCYPVVPAKGP